VAYHPLYYKFHNVVSICERMRGVFQCGGQQQSRPISAASGPQSQPSEQQYVGYWSYYKVTCTCIEVYEQVRAAGPRFGPLLLKMLKRSAAVISLAAMLSAQISLEMRC
jgi:hypothetical protein